MNTKRLQLIWILAVVCLLASAGWGGLWWYASQQTIPKQVHVVLRKPTETNRQNLRSDADIPIGSLRIEEAKQLLTLRKQQLEQLAVTIKGGTGEGKKKTWTLEQLGIEVDTKDALAALDRLNSGSLWKRAKYRWRFQQQLAIGVSLDKEVFVGKIRSIWGWMDAGEPVNATRKITKDDKVVYTPHKDAYRLDTDKMYAHATAAIGKAIGSNWGKNGKKLSPMTWPIELRVIHPSITLQRLKDEGVERLISSFTTTFRTSGAGRAYNVTMTAKTLSGMELAPGELFDYSKVIALTNKKYGYRQAPVILNGEFVPGVGGGICQVSSTLYNAVLFAGLDMVERRNHSLPVAYLPMGRDATYADDAINFKFKNTTGKHLVIVTEVENRRVTVKIFGTLPRTVQYKLDSKTVATVVPPVKEVPSASMMPGERRKLASGKPGYIVETYRTKLENGVKVSRTRISRDTYRAQPVVYAVAPEQSHPDNGKDEAPLLEDGVAQ
ncbi:VanW family protein [Paenibacillus sp. CF384]|uniref:VanW family protein n=1 Tax=Paenibacillus sp. CF384 TaxID=1884382 RepID=UPI00089758E4|nr:VanW family protein [Paenibacillus sp. CF384]SDX29139.1 Vancomycin resistance protein YoaR, contains peptidoglycan-binding and VanW domains [Paenibacillus sp. CF384]